jgi:hypothetical protein
MLGTHRLLGIGFWLGIRRLLSPNRLLGINVLLTHYVYSPSTTNLGCRPLRPNNKESGLPSVRTFDTLLANLELQHPTVYIYNIFLLNFKDNATMM